jgi:PAS domain S-box-containing protein
LATSQPVKVLIVDDVDLVVEWIQGQLEQLGYQVIDVAVDGLQAIDSTKRLHPDVIVTDINLPKLDGLEVARRIRKECPTPVVVLTPYDSPELVARAGDVGVGAYVLKPSSADELDRAIIISRARFEDLMALHRVNAALEREVAERERAEAKLSEKEARFKYIMKHNPNAIAVYDKDLHYMMVSDRYLQDYNIEEQDVIGRHHYEVFPEIPQRWREIHQRVLQGSVERADEDHFVRLDGSVDYNRWECRPWYTADGEVGGMITYTEVITERKRAELALRESEARFRAIFESAQDFIFIKDRDLRYVQVNPAMEALFGMTAEALIGKTDEDLFGAEAGAEVREMDLQVLQGEIIRQEHTKPVHGMAHTFHVIKVPMRDSEGAIIGLCGIARDITTRKQMEEELKRSQKDLQEFAYSISHDLQSPLRMVTGFLRILRQQYGEHNARQLDDQAHEYIGYAMEGAERMREMIRGLLAYSRVGTRGCALEPIDCEEVLARVLVDLMVPIEGGSKVEGTSEASMADMVITHDPLPTVLADGVQLGQVFQNLIDNAVKFRGDAPPHVHISACEDGERWRFAVRDNGIGIDPAQADRLFRVFERLHTEEEYPGTGIGLAICKKIVERHCGRIWLESEPGNGATFYFTLPKVDD